MLIKCLAWGLVPRKHTGNVFITTIITSSFYNTVVDSNFPELHFIDSPFVRKAGMPELRSLYFL